MDRRLTLRERITLRLHLRVCAWCARYQDQVLFLREALHRHAGHLEDDPGSDGASLSAGARERIKRALSDE